PVAMRRKTGRAGAAEWNREHGLLPELLVTQDVRAGLAITSTVDASDLLAGARSFPDEAIDRAWPPARRLLVAPAGAPPGNPPRPGAGSPWVPNRPPAFSH